MADRLPNGVKARADSAGDAWANEHRTELGSGFNLQDTDGCLGHIVFAQNTSERLFWEYVPDAFRNSKKSIRDFAVVAVFDRTRTESLALSEGKAVSRAFYLWLCRSVGRGQPVTPRFFYVVGSASPWRLIELSTETSAIVQRKMLQRGGWRELWDAMGLTATRHQLRKWLERAELIRGGSR